MGFFRNVISKLQNRKGSSTIDFMISLPWIMMVMVIFLSIVVVISSKAYAMESMRIGLDKMEENGGMDSTVHSIIYNSLVSQGAIASSIVITGTPAHQQHGTMLTLTIRCQIVKRTFNPSGSGYTETVEQYTKTKVCYSRYVVR